MDVFNFCWMILLGESKKSNVFFDKNTCNVRNEIDENFNKPLNRISYLYKFGGYNISFFHQCFQEFCAKVPDSLKIIDILHSQKKLTICSMSAGPGTDIIGFLYSLHLIDKQLVNTVEFKVISRHGSWRNLVTEMINSSIITVPNETTCKLIECDFLKDLSKKAQGYLKEADILLMCNSFSSPTTPADVISNTLKAVIQLLKPGALVFFIFSKEKSTYFKELLSSGSFLYEPVEVALENMPYNKTIVELVGVKPVCSGRSLFAVWQKSHEIKYEINFQKETENNLPCRNQHSVAKLVTNKSDIEDINFPTSSLSNLERGCLSDSNISSSSIIRISSSLEGSSNFSSSSSSNQITTDNSVNFNQRNINFPKTNVHNFANNTSLVSLNATDLSAKKKSTISCGSAHTKRRNNEKDMDSLLKSFGSLIMRLEGLISSKGSLEHSHVKEKQPASNQLCNQNIYLGHCRCSLKSCQFDKNGSMCCCDTWKYCNCINVGNHNCFTSVAQSSYRTFPQEVPSVVIPLQNLSNESLTHILSLVTQNTSANRTTLY